jgi:uncharacterized membrane protein
MQQDISAKSSRGFVASGVLLGFGLGGFFDGILLHQILQWHHLLSSLEAESGLGLRGQVMADGLFHAVMYLITAVGLCLLWQARSGLDGRGADRALIALMLIGFGLWHVVDAVLSHWLLGIHRIRMDTDNPLAWDLIWLVVFGLAPLALGRWLHRRGGGGGHGRAFAALAVAILIGAGLLAARPPAGVSQVVAVFRPDLDHSAVFAAAAALDARVVWSDSRGEVWVFDVGPGRSGLGLYRHGAMFVASPLFSAGCLSWMRGRSA